MTAGNGSPCFVLDRLAVRWLENVPARRQARLQGG